MWLVQLATFFSSKIQILKKLSVLMTQPNPTQRGKRAWVDRTRIIRDFSKVMQELLSFREKAPVLPQITTRKATAILMIIITASHWSIYCASTWVACTFHVVAHVALKPILGVNAACPFTDEDTEVQNVWEIAQNYITKWDCWKCLHFKVLDSTATILICFQ